MDIKTQLTPETEELNKLKHKLHLDVVNISNGVFKRINETYQPVKFNPADEIYIDKVKVKDGMGLEERIYHLLNTREIILDENGENPALQLTDIYDYSYIQEKIIEENIAIVKLRKEKVALVQTLGNDIIADIYSKDLNNNKIKMEIGDKLEKLRLLHI